MKERIRQTTCKMCKHHAPRSGTRLSLWGRKPPSLDLQV